MELTDSDLDFEQAEGAVLQLVDALTPFKYYDG